MRRQILMAGVSAVVFSAAYATTPLNVKTGLWEATRITRIEGNTIPKAALAEMPPEQRAKIEKAMTARAAAKPVPKTSTSCLTEKERNDGGFGETDTDCKKTVVSATATHWESTLTCNRDGTTQTGHMTLDAPSPDRVVGKMELSTGEGGKITMDFTGKWVGASCPASADN
jgi:hypothetical protein